MEFFMNSKFNLSLTICKPWFGGVACLFSYLVPMMRWFQSWKDQLFFPWISQSSMIECGTTSLAIVMKYYGLGNLVSVFNEWAQINEEGTSILALKQIALRLGFEAKGYQLDYDSLAEANFPCVAHYNGNHYVVIYQYHPQYLKVSDPAIGKVTLSREAFEEKWNGVVLDIFPTEATLDNQEYKQAAVQQKAHRQQVIQRFYKATFNASWKGMPWAIVLSLLLVPLGLTQALFLKLLLDGVLPQQNQSWLWYGLMGLGVVFLLQMGLSVVRDRLLTQFTAKFEWSFFSKYFEHFIYLKQSYFDKRKKDDLIINFQENLRLRGIVSSTMIEGIIEAPLALVYLALMFVFSVPLAIIATLVALLYGVVLFVLTPQSVSSGQKMQYENSRYLWNLLDTILSITNVKLLSSEQVKFSTWKTQYKQNVDQSLETAKVGRRLDFGLKGLFLLSQSFVFGFGAYLVYQNTLTLGDYLASFFIFNIIINRVAGSASIWLEITSLIDTFNRLYDTLSQKTEKTEQTKTIANLQINKIQFNQVRFNYDENEDDAILQDISFEIKQGDFVGIVGRNGSGKSTLARLLTKLYTNYEGSIYLGEHNLQHIPSQQVRDKVVMIPQEVELFNATLGENITFGLENTTQEQVDRAVQLADLQAFVTSKYLGYDLRIGMHGTKLSGGEKLKLAFARLFMRNPEVIILDEASSALDADAEARILQNVKTHFKGKTIISIAHRITTLKTADQILVIDKGKVSEQGTHQVLLDQQGTYYQFMQSYLNF